MKVEPVIQITSITGVTTINACIKFEDFATSMEFLNLLVEFLKKKRGPTTLPQDKSDDNG